MKKNIISFVAGVVLGLVLGTSTANAQVAAPVVTTTSSVSGRVVLTKDNTLVMNDYFSGDTVANVTQKAKEMDAKLPSKEAIYLVIDSGGGSIDAGIELIQNLNTLNRPVNTITLFSASMGFQTVQGVTGKRLITKDGTLMSHKARGGFYGEFPGQLDSRYGYYLRRIQRLDEVAAARTNGKHSVKSYASLIENEYWCDGDDCVKQGFADTVINPTCDNSLQGTHNKLYDRFIYMGHVVEIVDVMSNCPLITSELSWNIYIDGQPLFEQHKKDDTKNTAKVPQEDLYYGRSVNETVLNTLPLETAENIKKQISKKLDARQSTDKREVRKY